MLKVTDILRVSSEEENSLNNATFLSERLSSAKTIKMNAQLSYKLFMILLAGINFEVSKDTSELSMTMIFWASGWQKLKS